MFSVWGSAECPWDTDGADSLTQGSRHWPLLIETIPAAVFLNFTFERKWNR